MEEQVLITRREGRVGIITLNRPAQLNALNDALMDALGAALLAMDADAAIGCIVLTGGAKVFAAGADVEAISDMNFAKAVNTNFITRNWETILRVRKPVIGAVAGFALGGGCELAMMCDFIIAADNARFGQPEIKLGIIPGAGGTQRLPRAISKAKAMEMVLTGRMMHAEEAERAGLVARVVPAEQLEQEALASAALIAGMSLPSVMAAKESLNRAYESALSEGLQFERKSFHALFSTADQKEGMAAFLARRKPQFSHS
ncbi:MAG TPA: enoyl-CoA hydratase [Telluria sp.]